MQVHVIRPTDGWILQRMAESFTIPGSTLGTQPDPAATVNFYVNYYLYAGPTATLDVGFFTHRPVDEDPGLRARFDEVAAQVDACVAMCDHTAAHLDPHRTLVLHCAPDPLLRKRPSSSASWAADSPGSGRSGLRRSRPSPGVAVRFTGGMMPSEANPDFYRSIDSLVVLGSNEGGPMPVLEAIAMGKPVIAPDVGFAWDYPVLRYDGTRHGLKALIRNVYHLFRCLGDCVQRLQVFFRQMLALDRR